MSREHERLQRLVANEAGIISAYFAAKDRYLNPDWRGGSSAFAWHEWEQAFRAAVPYLEDPEAEAREVLAAERERRARLANRSRLEDLPREVYESPLPPSREPPCGPYR